MNSVLAGQQEPDLMSTLREAHRALDGGKSQEARLLAQQVLNSAKERADRQIEAHALLCLANCDRLVSRLRRASDASRRAALLFRGLDDLPGESSAMMMLAHLYTLLGRNEEAVEAAIFSVRLCEALPIHPQTALAHNYLGLAYCWSGNFDDAQNSLDTASKIAGLCVPSASSYQPRMNQAWVETFRIASERYHTGQHPGSEKRQALVSAFRHIEMAGEAGPLKVGADVVGHTMSALLVGLLKCWDGRFDAANAELEVARSWLQKLDTTSWLSAFFCWVSAEIAWAKQDWDAAESALSLMTELAETVEHEQLACFGHLLAKQVYERQGKHEQAQAESRKLRRREQCIRAESLKSREALVTYQLNARQNEQTLQRLQEKSKLLERWSLEDALTGIANRRHFEQVLAERLRNAAASGKPISLALIDVDQFKSVNDKFTHQVGDRVLKTVAGILSNQVREHDLAARLSGDEFVVMFARADSPDAEQVCERIRAAVSGFDWSGIAPGLCLSVSVGISQSAEGDTVESLLHRSDIAMYQGKPGANLNLWTGR